MFRKSTIKQRKCVEWICETLSYDFNGDIFSFDACYKFISRYMNTAKQAQYSVYMDAMASYYSNFDY